MINSALDYHKVSSRYRQIRQREEIKAQDLYGPSADLYKVHQEAMLKLIIELLDELQNSKGA